MGPLLLLSESNQSELSSLLQPPTIFTFYTSTAKMPSCMAKATSRSMSHNQKALWMNSFLKSPPSQQVPLHWPRIWSLLLCGVVSGLGLVALETDSCIHVRGNILLAVYDTSTMSTIFRRLVQQKKNCDTVYKELEKHIKIEYKVSITLRHCFSTSRTT